jgi:hypothetical protein
VQTPADEDTEAGRFILPVSGRVAVLRPPCGADDLLLLEAARTPAGDAALALALARRLARAAEGEPLHWDALPVTDLDALVLRLRQMLVGDRVRADVACPAGGCGRRIDIAFGIDDFLAHHAPEPGAWSTEPDDEPGWFRLVEPAEGVRFRLPAVADQLAVMGRPGADDELARRCIRPPDVPPRLRQRVEEAMEALAPSLSADLKGVCPECGAEVVVEFDARWYCLRELRDRAAFIYQDVDLLARRYHWTERDILALPHARRAAYADLARRVEGV